MSAPLLQLLAGQTAAEPDPELLARILEEPELSGAGQPGSALSAIIEALQTLFGTLMGSEGAVGTAEFIRLVFLVLTAVVVIWLVRKIIQKLSPARSRESFEALSPIRLESPEHHQDLADAALAKGQLRPALRHTLLSALAALERSRWASYGRHKTNREYLRSIERRGAPKDLCQAFGELVGAYDPLWYGGGEIEAGAVARIGAHAATARTAAVAHPRTAEAL